MKRNKKPTKKLSNNMSRTTSNTQQEVKKLEELANAQKAKTKAPVEPKAPAIPTL